ncbi:MAG: PSD1 domain-containing protein [Planctomycetaceae bacterium]|nr:PSD1 domain-containing protein [Planctomycetaceae bacterium]
MKNNLPLPISAAFLTPSSGGMRSGECDGSRSIGVSNDTACDRNASRMRSCGRRILAALIGLLLIPADASAQESVSSISFIRDVRPIFDRHCVSCHGADLQEGGLRLDVRDAALRGGENYSPALVPGQPEQSPLWLFVRNDEADLLMPPKGTRLSVEEVQTLKQWIESGAVWPEQADSLPAESDHWAFQPLIRPNVPGNSGDGGSAAIDALIAEQLNANQLTFSDRADRRTLIRRLYLVMHGLLPPPDEVERFVNDQSPSAWADLVERVLISPRYGERWAQHWLDLVRFGETNGFETNRERPNAWPYRDYVIRAFNDDLPYDQFVKQQIAGDQMNVPVATGFLVAGPYDLVKSRDIALTRMQRQDELTDIVNTTGTTFLGLTMGCAKCHNHKFDPISQTDFYALEAVFAGVQHGTSELPPDAEIQEELEALDRRIEDLTVRLRPFIPPSSAGFLLVDDTQIATAGARGFTAFRPAAGEGKNPAGTDPGYASDPGSDDRSPNVSGGSYTWWMNEPGKNVGMYVPLVAGRFRIWISWGAGFPTHSTDTSYVLDRDGDPDSTDDQSVLATVDQQRFAGVQTPDGELPSEPLWSGFLNAGVAELTADSVILVRGGFSGTAVTTDILALESVPDGSTDTVTSARPMFRPPVNPELNTETFAPTEARRIRFTILETNASQPCIDELSVFSGNDNVALAETGTTASASGSLAGYDIHKLEHINDGQFGNGRSWICDQSQGWVELTLSEPRIIDRIEWARDRDGKYRDRLAISYRIEVQNATDDWLTIASSHDRLPFSSSSGNVAEVTYQFAGHDPQVAHEGRQWLKELRDIQAARAQLASPKLAYTGRFEAPPQIHRLYRGEPMEPREAVGPGTISLLGKLPVDETATDAERRTALAEWLTDPGNPLVARVWVNRIWQFHFGRGLVDTSNDFGNNGVPPTHPELLDWLAAELIESGWSTRHIHRLLLLSQTWQQSSAPDAAALAADGSTRFLWRFPPRRMEAEGIRDNILLVSGDLDLRMGGPGFDGFEVEMENVRHYFPKTSYGPGDWRRMVYMTKVRMEKESTFGVFDCPDGSQVVARRTLSTTPLQALNLLNSEFILQQAEHLARRAVQEHPEDLTSQIELIWRLCYSRRPTPAECDDAKAFVAAFELNQLCRAVLNSNEFLFIP